MGSLRGKCPFPFPAGWAPPSSGRRQAELPMHSGFPGDLALPVHSWGIGCRWDQELTCLGSRTRGLVPTL